MQITVNYGVANSLTRDMPEGATLRDILTNQNIMAALGASSENVVTKIDGVAQDAGLQPPGRPGTRAPAEAWGRNRGGVQDRELGENFTCRQKFMTPLW